MRKDMPLSPRVETVLRYTHEAPKSVRIGLPLLFIRSTITRDYLLLSCLLKTACPTMITSRHETGLL